MVAIKVGSFVKATATGNQDITLPSGLPDMTAQAAGTWAILFWTAGSTAATGVWDSALVGPGIGFTTGAANSYAVGTWIQDGLTNNNGRCGRRMAAKCITIPSNSNPPVIMAEADFVSFPTSNTMRLNWTTNAGVAAIIGFTVITGLTGAKVVNWTTPTSVGNKAVTGVGFNPDLVIHAMDGSATALPRSLAGEIFDIGMMNKHGQQWANGTISGDAISPTNCSRYQQTDACLIGATLNEVVYFQSHFVSMDSDGFTIYGSTVDVTAIQVISLCLDGISSKIGAFVRPTAASNIVTTNHGFTVKGSIFSHIASGPANGPLTYAWWGLGMEDGTNKRGVAFGDDDNVTPSQSDSVWQNDASVIGQTNSGANHVTTVSGSMSASSLVDFTMTWSSAASYGAEVLYCLLGDAGVNTYPSVVGV